MEQFKHLNKDLVGALLLALVGTAVAVAGYSYHLGTPIRMGPGLVPFALGLLMILIAALIAVTAGKTVPRKLGSKREPVDFHGSLRGWICILGGVGSFVVLGRYGGLVPASFVAVFISALGDRESNVVSSALLAAGLTLAGVIIFHFGLRLQLPLLQWG